VSDPIEITVSNDFYEPSILFDAFPGWHDGATDGQKSLYVLNQFAEKQTALLKNDDSQLNSAVICFETGTSSTFFIS
jgi:hypothetical protein